MTARPYGTWPSPITAELIVSRSVSIGDLCVGTDALWWSEGRPDEGGRVQLVRQRASGGPVDVLPEGFAARTRVHEYGGGAWTFRRSTSNYNMITPFDYNDIRIALGAEFLPTTRTGVTGNFEVGYVFYRQLFYVDGPPQIVDLPSTIMFRLGLGY